MLQQNSFKNGDRDYYENNNGIRRKNRIGPGSATLFNSTSYKIEGRKVCWIYIPSLLKTLLYFIYITKVANIVYLIIIIYTLADECDDDLRALPGKYYVRP